MPVSPRSNLADPSAATSAGCTVISCVFWGMKVITPGVMLTSPRNAGPLIHASPNNVTCEVVLSPRSKSYLSATNSRPTLRKRAAKLRASSWRSSHRAGQWRTPSSQASTDDCVTSFSTSRSFSTCRTWRTNSNTGAATTIAVARLAPSPIRRRKSSRDGKLAPLKDPLAAAPAGPSLSHRELAVEGLIQAPRLFPLQPFSRTAIRSQVRPTEAAIFPAENRFDPTILTLVMALFYGAGQPTEFFQLPLVDNSGHVSPRLAWSLC